MEKIKHFFLIAVCMSVLNLNAQQLPIVRQGLIRAQLTLSPSYMFTDKQSYFYLHGNLEGYVSDNLSLSGEGYYGLGNVSSGENLFANHHNLFYGASWHFICSLGDFYAGLQPGLSFTRLKETGNNLVQATRGTNPLISAVAGYNFYIHKIFHFFIQTRFITGQHNYDAVKDLSEIRISAGLGFNINTSKQQ